MVEEGVVYLIFRTLHNGIFGYIYIYIYIYIYMVGFV